jgi:hypothetical protein
MLVTYLQYLCYAFYRDGVELAQFGQRKAWPVLDAKMVSAGKGEDTEEEGSDTDDHFAGRPRSPEVI